MGAPPSAAGALQRTVASPMPAVAVTDAGAPGATTGMVGVTTTERADAGPVPVWTAAATSKLYPVPLVRPVTSKVSMSPFANSLPTCVSPSKTRTRYPTIADPPSEAGRLHFTVTVPFPATGVPMLGALGSGTPAGVTGAEGAE